MVLSVAGPAAGLVGAIVVAAPLSSFPRKSCRADCLQKDFVPAPYLAALPPGVRCDVGPEVVARRRLEHRLSSFPRKSCQTDYLQMDFVPCLGAHHLVGFVPVGSVLGVLCLPEYGRASSLRRSCPTDCCREDCLGLAVAGWPLRRTFLRVFAPRGYRKRRQGRSA